jgi:phenolic acid decarboxylase
MVAHIRTTTGLRASTIPPASRWIPVGDLARGSDKSNKLAPTTDFAGTSLNLHFENGWHIEMRFKTASHLLWREVSRTKNGRWTEETYSATKARERIYFLDFLKHRERATSMSLVLDLGAQIFTAVIGQLPTREETEQGLLSRALAGSELTRVSVALLSGAINRPFSETNRRHDRTDELVGKRVEYTYSPADLYEHLYLNEHLYTWHCITGSEKGLADTDRCHYLKIADRLYLFVWMEKVIPTLGVLLEDFEKMRTSGKLLGYESNDFRKLTNFMIGAKARILEQAARQDSRG